ncbi:MAG: hypothetical protein COB90_03245 [Hyphomicrobiales bacterium]|nr:MAG: hypothetical protein COB90_03245 [Hyphomicrobiales bacterium]
MGFLLKLFVFLWLGPLALSTALYYTKDHPDSWRTADWSSAGLLPQASSVPQASVQVYAARTGKWKGIFAEHSWIVMKPANAKKYVRLEVVGWGLPVRINAYDADGRWYGNEPRLVYAAYGKKAEHLIPQIITAVENYPLAQKGSYRVWPGPNSNTFISHVVKSVEGFDVALPALAAGKDYPVDEPLFGPTPSGSGYRFLLGGWFAVSVGWIEGFEISLLSSVVGIDIRYPAIKLPGLGRIGEPLPYVQAVPAT